MDVSIDAGFCSPDETVSTTTNPTAPKPLPSVEFLCEALIYDEESGELTWKERPRHHFDSDQGQKIFNGQYVGKTAGSLTTHGYVSVRLSGTEYLTHRLITKMVTGEEPAQIDHINGLRDDNSWLNLRPATNTTNQRNCKIRTINTSGVNGVSWDKRRGKWRAQIAVNGKTKCLGRYDDWFDAVCARKSADNRFGFHANHGRRA